MRRAWLESAPSKPRGPDSLVGSILPLPKGARTMKIRRVRPWHGGVVALLLLLGLQPARAGVSPQDGYTTDGAPKLFIELAPYLWLPASNAQATLRNGATEATSAGVPSVSQLTNVLTGDFMGLGVLRYGPWSAELDI